MGSKTTTERSVEQLQALIQTRLRGWVCDLRLLVRDRGLILQGRSSTYYAKQLAQHTATEITGLAILSNDIEVRGVSLQ